MSKQMPHSNLRSVYLSQNLSSDTATLVPCIGLAVGMRGLRAGGHEKSTSWASAMEVVPVRHSVLLLLRNKKETATSAFSMSSEKHFKMPTDIFCIAIDNALK